MARKTRRKIGGSIWNSDTENIREKVSKANEACQYILGIIQRNKSFQFSNAFTISLTIISTSLTSILESLNRIEAIGEDFREEQDREEEPLDEIDEIARRAIARRPYEDDSE